ncbi:MAG: hypothetical protein ABFS18_12635 [Thermodesulfobacteriota bacterium]
MDLERIFTLVVIVIIWVISNAVRKITTPEQKDQGSTAQKPGLFKILQQSLATLEEKSQGGESIALDKYFQPQTAEPESLIELAEDAMQQGEALPPSAPPKAVEPRATIMQKQPQMTKRRKLQKAIIWAEILAPPVALRD